MVLVKVEEMESVRATQNETGLSIQEGEWGLTAEDHASEHPVYLSKKC